MFTTRVIPRMMHALTKPVRFFLEFVIVVGDDLVVQQEVVVVLIHFRQDVCQRLVHHVHDLFALEQFAVFLNGEIAVKFVEDVLRIGCGFNAFLVIQELSVHGIQHLAALEFDGCVHALVHQVGQRALGAAKTAVHIVSSIRSNAFGQVNGRRVEFTGVPKTAGTAGACSNVLKHVAFMETQLQVMQLLPNVFQIVIVRTGVVIIVIVFCIIVQIIV